MFQRVSEAYVYRSECGINHSEMLFIFSRVSTSHAVYLAYTHAAVWYMILHRGRLCLCGRRVAEEDELNKEPLRGLDGIKKSWLIMLLLV